LSALQGSNGVSLRDVMHTRSNSLTRLGLLELPACLQRQNLKTLYNVDFSS